MSTEAAPTPLVERSWWLRALAALAAPQAIFVQLRDESEDAVEARNEPLFAILALASISVVLVSPTFRRMLNDGRVSVLLIPVLAFIAGGIYAAIVYWLGGGLLFGAARRFGSEGTWLRARHVLALSLVTFWPIRIVVYGEDLFRTGGDDYGRGDAIFGGVYVGFVAWSLWLLLVGVRSVHGWTWGRSAATVALAAAFPVLIVIAATH
jgi:hypothetical protein